ncbi:unnamed protein product [Brassica rapa]|uniref:NYN domain-containing protein n=1 Tax=Brassica campestris TaxID=3711 RepID=A0A8D9H1V2_BRACM|nr:unnamed protein product [Brassica rapa]
MLTTMKFFQMHNENRCITETLLHCLEPITPDNGTRTVIFWDAVDCPFPLSFSPDQIYQSIQSALVKMGSSDKITIRAYVNDTKKTSKKTWDSRIYFLPGGDKASRRVRMLNNIFLLLKDSPYLNRPYEASLVLVSDQFKHDAYYIEMLRNLKLIHYYVILVTPTEDINKPESPEWPGLLIDIGGWCPFNDETSEPCSKKYKGG